MSTLDEIHPAESGELPAAARRAGDGTVSCPHCGGTRFRRSRLRLRDLPELLLLRISVRCSRCGLRQHVDAFLAMLASSHKNRKGIRRGDETGVWKHWVDPSASMLEASPNAESEERAAMPEHLPPRRDDAGIP